jgi:glyoxylase-like metal-dependent hydrolase (beta-lactamase superfamily II)
MLPETPLPMNPRISRHPHGIFAVDAEYQYSGHAAVHIIENEGRAAFVDTGTNNSVPYLLAALDELGLSREAVDYVFVTHVHLDHAGGAGSLMRELPNALALLHPRGAPHMVEPAKLVAGARAVYGDDVFDRLYGDIVPIAADRVVSVPDGYRCELAGRQFELIHTPGHALHHYAVVDQAHSSIFAGDTFGVSYREFDTPQGAFIAPATTPAQFDPEQLIGSIDRLVAYAPESIYLMHYSRVTNIPRLAAMLKSQIREFVRIAHESAGSADVHGAIRAAMFGLWTELLQRQGSTVPAVDVARLLETDLELNAQGLVVWLERQRKNTLAQA